MSTFPKLDIEPDTLNGFMKVCGFLRVLKK